MELLLIMANYPYDYGDAVFIKPEIPFLSKSFDKIHVINTDNSSAKYRKNETPSNIKVISSEMFFPNNSGKCQWLRACFISIFHPFRLFLIFLNEFYFLLKRKKMTLPILKTAIIYLLNANFTAVLLKRYLLDNPEIKLIYTYWYKYETLASLICKKLFNIQIKCITRTHGGDLYEFVHKNNYQPYKIWMDRNIDNVFFVSKAGYDYYINLFAGTNKNKYIISNLGIENNYKININYNNNIQNRHLNVVSCSYMVKGKRINLIIEALSKINDITINWIHIGDGPEKYFLEELVISLLKNKNNITYTFKGHMDNDSIKYFYSKNYFDCFLSTTFSEGGNPVSMMEAISFGIPVIASAVGGVPEIVNHETGILLNPDNCIEELVNALYRFSGMTISERESLGKSCRIYWEKKYRAETQYLLFIDALRNLL